MENEHLTTCSEVGVDFGEFKVKEVNQDIKDHNIRNWDAEKIFETMTNFISLYSQIQKLEQEGKYSPKKHEWTEDSSSVKIGEKNQ